MSIISISGKISSGKDTVGKIIQILTASPHFNNQAVVDFLKRDLYEPGWKIKKFADKLKDIACLLIGCTRRQLEDREFKEKELGPEWDRIIASDGKIYLPDEYPDLEYSKLTPRLLLQLLGTECGRQIIHPSIWVNALMSEYKPYSKGTAHNLENWSEVYRHTSCKNCGKEYCGWKRQYLCKECIEDDSVQFYPNWIITDTRFPNELKAVKDKGGITIRVNRPEYCPNCPMDNITSQDCGDCAVYQDEIYQGLHESETALDNAEFDYIIENNGTLEELIGKVKEILIKENLL